MVHIYSDLDRKKWLEYYYKNKKKRREDNIQWIKDNREKRRKYYIVYRQTEKGKIATLKAIKKYETNHPERKNAWNKAQRLLKKPCMKCNIKNSHKHHPDPLRPLDVIYLCPLHHKQEHMI